MNRKFVRTFVSLLPVLALLVSGASAAPSGYKGYPPAARTKPGNFVAAVTHPGLRVDTSDIVALRDHPTAQLWDNRSLKEFTGEEQKKGGVPRGTHSGELA